MRKKSTVLLNAADEVSQLLGKYANRLADEFPEAGVDWNTRYYTAWIYLAAIVMNGLEFVLQQELGGQEKIDELKKMLEERTAAEKKKEKARKAARAKKAEVKKAKAKKVKGRGKNHAKV